MGFLTCWCRGSALSPRGAGCPWIRAPPPSTPRPDFPRPPRCPRERLPAPAAQVGTVTQSPVEAGRFLHQLCTALPKLPQQTVSFFQKEKHLRCSGKRPQRPLSLRCVVVSTGQKCSGCGRRLLKLVNYLGATLLSSDHLLILCISSCISLRAYINSLKVREIEMLQKRYLTFNNLVNCLTCNSKVM